MKLRAVPSASSSQDDSEEPCIALKIGPASCFCMCSRTAANPYLIESQIDVQDVGPISYPHVAAPVNTTKADPLEADSATGRQYQTAEAASISIPGDPATVVISKADLLGAECATGRQDQKAEAANISIPRDLALHATINGCGCEFDIKEAERTGVLNRDDPIQKYYKKDGFFGSITGFFGDKKTMYCHHLTLAGQFGARAAALAGITCKTEDEVWKFLNKTPCHGRFSYDHNTGKLKCGGCMERDHDNTCNEETCLFIASGLPCPTPPWALK